MCFTVTIFAGGVYGDDLPCQDLGLQRLSLIQRLAPSHERAMRGG
jgi:hypothetical protein